MTLVAALQVCKVLAKLPEAERKSRVMCIDTDLEGSTGLKVCAVCFAVARAISAQFHGNHALLPSRALRFQLGVALTVDYFRPHRAEFSETIRMHMG